MLSWLRSCMIRFRHLKCFSQEANVISLCVRLNNYHWNLIIFDHAPYLSKFWPLFSVRLRRIKTWDVYFIKFLTFHRHPYINSKASSCRLEVRISSSLSFSWEILSGRDDKIRIPRAVMQYPLYFRNVIYRMDLLNTRNFYFVF